jgi:ribosomal protein L11 methyltransferase
MKWKKYTLYTTTEAEDIVSSILDSFGVEGIEIEDNVPLSEAETKGMFIDILPELPEDKGEAKIHFYLEDTSLDSELFDNIRAELKEMSDFVDLGSCIIEESETEDKDWINNWKKYFKPFYVDDILIKPTWEQVPENDNSNLMIEIDPGTAFGTGSHETTQLCIKQLKKYIKAGDKVLDLGCGSGILSIAAIKLFASEVVGTDLDENAITASNENALINNISKDEFKVYMGNIIEDEELKENVGFEEYDIIVANILADVIILLTKVVPAHLKKGGVFIMSGIINTKENAVREALEAVAELKIIETTYQGEWVSFTAVKNN